MVGLMIAKVVTTLGLAYFEYHSGMTSKVVSVDAPYSVLPPRRLGVYAIARG